MLCGVVWWDVVWGGVGGCGVVWWDVAWCGVELEWSSVLWRGAA